MKRRLFLIAAAVLAFTTCAWADGLVIPPRDYEGSLEEKAQEAIIVFKSGTAEKSAVQDLILKIHVAGKTDEFAWVVPLPSKPKTSKEDSKLFKEAFEYVEARRLSSRRKPKAGLGVGSKATPEEEADVKVISREIVGSYDVAVVKEQKAGTLNNWLREEGYQELKGGEEVVGYYRKKGYVFTCIKVSDAALESKGSVDLHPLRFTFETGGRDGIYFPMKLTGLQNAPFDVNLYVFYGAWLNDRINGFGYEHRKFSRRWRDYDSRKCKPNAGKLWAKPKKDSYLVSYASKIANLTKFFAEHYPEDRFYLTNIQAYGLKPVKVREWTSDLWLFPYYTDESFVPYDAREGGVAEQ